MLISRSDHCRRMFLIVIRLIFNWIHKPYAPTKTWVEHCIVPRYVNIICLLIMVQNHTDACITFTIYTRRRRPLFGHSENHLTIHISCVTRWPLDTPRERERDWEKMEKGEFAYRITPIINRTRIWNKTNACAYALLVTEWPSAKQKMSTTDTHRNIFHLFRISNRSVCAQLNANDISDNSENLRHSHTLSLSAAFRSGHRPHKLIKNLLKLTNLPYEVEKMHKGTHEATFLISEEFSILERKRLDRKSFTINCLHDIRCTSEESSKGHTINHIFWDWNNISRSNWKRSLRICWHSNSDLDDCV